MEHERDARIAQRVDAGSDRHLSVVTEGRDPIGVDPELLAEVKQARPGGKLDHRVQPVDHLKRGAPVIALDEAGDVLVEHLAAHPSREHVDALLSCEQAGDVAVVKQPIGAG